jgi:hypothetical protein
MSPIPGDTNALETAGYWVKPTGRDGKNPYKLFFDFPSPRRATRRAEKADGTEAANE